MKLKLLNCACAIVFSHKVCEKKMLVICWIMPIVLTIIVYPNCQVFSDLQFFNVILIVLMIMESMMMHV